MPSLSEISRRIGTVALATAISMNAYPHYAEASSSVLQNLEPSPPAKPENNTSQSIKYTEFMAFILNPQNNLNDLSENLIITLNDTVRLLKDPNTGPVFLGDSTEKVSMYMLINQRDGNMIFIYAPAGKDLSEIFKEGKALKLDRVKVPPEILKAMEGNSVFPFIYKGITDPLSSCTPLIDDPCPTNEANMASTGF